MQLRSESRYVVSGTPSKNLVGIHDLDQDHEGDFPTSTAEADEPDFKRLANIAGFLGTQPFNSDHALFLKAFYEPYTRRGEIVGISNFLSRCMVRHQVPDIALPALTRQVVQLGFNRLERITYNVLLALFASNAVQSERLDVRQRSCLLPDNAEMLLPGGLFLPS